MAALKFAPAGMYGVPDPAKNPTEAYLYAAGRRQVILDSARQRPLIRLWDKNMDFIGVVASERAVSAEELMHAAGECSITLRANDWLSEFLRKDVRAEEDIHITIDPVPTKRSWRTRWGGKVTAVNVKRTSEGVHEVELQAIHNRKHLEYILLGANPLFPPEIQLPKAYIMPGNTRTATSFSLFLNLARQYFPLLSIPANIANPGSWLTTSVGNLSPLHWPVQVQFVNPLLDQSRFTFITSRWTAASTVLEPILKDGGCMIRAYTWLPEDEDSPHPELAEMVGQQLSRPSRACVVLACEDKSGATGPTGTAVDGVVNLVASLADDMITETLFPVDADGDGVTDPLFRKWLMTAPKPPTVIFRDTEHSAIIDAQRSIHKMQGRTVMTGGQSPGWVNQLQTFAIRYGLSQLAQVINYGLGAYEQPGVEGLDNLYQGQLDNTLLAYMRFTDPRRVIQAGPYAFLERMESNSSTAYTMAGVVNLRQSHWKARPYTSFKTNVVNGFPWLVNVDFVLGDRVGFELERIIHVDQVSAIKIAYDESTPLSYGLSIGTDGEEEDPLQRGLRSLQAAWGVIGMIAGDGGDAF